MTPFNLVPTTEAVTNFTVRNKYPQLPLDATFAPFQKVRISTKVDLRNTYHHWVHFYSHSMMSSATYWTSSSLYILYPLPATLLWAIPGPRYPKVHPCLPCLYPGKVHSRDPASLGLRLRFSTFSGIPWFWPSLTGSPSSPTEAHSSLFGFRGLSALAITRRRMARRRQEGRRTVTFWHTNAPLKGAISPKSSPAPIPTAHCLHQPAHLLILYTVKLNS